MRRAILLVSLGLTALLVLLALAVGVLLFTSWGHQRVGMRIEQVVNSEIAGTIRIEHISEIDLPRVKAQGIRIADPRGQVAIDVQNADIEFDLRALASGNLIWKRAEIAHGVVRIHEDEQGKLNMEETFRAKKKSGQKKPKTLAEREAQESDLDLRSMVTSDMTLHISGKGMPTLLLTKLYGIMRVQAPPGREVQLRFDQYRGTLAQGLPHGVLQFQSVTGQVTPGHEQLLQFRGTGRFEGEAVSFKLGIWDEPKTKVNIDAHFPEVSGPSLKTLGLDAWSAFSPSLSIEVHQEPLR